MGAHLTLLHDAGDRWQCLACGFRDRLPVLVRRIAEGLRAGTVARLSHHDAPHHDGQLVRLEGVFVYARDGEYPLEGRVGSGRLREQYVGIPRLRSLRDAQLMVVVLRVIGGDRVVAAHLDPAHGIARRDMHAGRIEIVLPSGVWTSRISTVPARAGAAVPGKAAPARHAITSAFVAVTNTALLHFFLYRGRADQPLGDVIVRLLNAGVSWI